MLKNYSKNQTPERTRDMIRDMVNLVTELQSANQFLLESDRENMGGNIHRYEDLLGPWCQYFGATMSNARQAVNRLHTQDISRADFVKLIGELIELIQHEIKTARAELIMQSIREAFANVKTIAEAFTLARLIETTKSDELEAYLKAYADAAAKVDTTETTDSTKKPGVPTIKFIHVTKGNGQT